VNLREFIEATGQVIAPELAAGFTGRISLDLDLRQGGIAKVSVRKEHDLRAHTAGTTPPVPTYHENGKAGS
jgi:hypothetical protein